MTRTRQRAASGLAQLGERLGLTMKFSDPAVIAANQAGRLTPEQINLIARAAHPASRGCGLIVVPGLFLLLIVGTFIALKVEDRLPISPRPYYVGLGLIVLIAIGVLISARANAARARVLRKLQTAQIATIEHADGEIAWNQKKECYCLHVPGHEALVFPALVGDLVRISLTSYLRPGPYCFYYVSDTENGTEVMISAQPIPAGRSGDEQARLAVQQGLCLAVDFSMAELAANQQGMLTEQQVSSLPREIRRKGSFVVRQVTGEVRVRVVHIPGDEGPGSSAYVYEASNLRFQVPHAAGAALGGPGLRHKIYYLEGTDRLLSIEPLPFQR